MIKEFVKQLKDGLDRIDNAKTYDKGNGIVSVDFVKQEIDKLAEKFDKIFKERDQKVVKIVEDCKLYRNTFILKKELIRKLEEAFPEK